MVSAASVVTVIAVFALPSAPITFLVEERSVDNTMSSPLPSLNPVMPLLAVPTPLPYFIWYSATGLSIRV